MYVWQMNDGTWRISLLTGQGHKFAAILANGEAYRQYACTYCCEADARNAERRIRELVQ